MVATPTNARAAWRNLHGRSKASQKRWETAQKVFRQEFPRGQRQSIRPEVRFWSEMALTGEPFSNHWPHLSQLHPRAFQFIAQFGINQRAFDWKESAPYDERLQPEWGRCFLNARLFLEYIKGENTMESAVYVEGIAVGATASPMLHAWNAVNVTSKTAIDWTLYYCSTVTRYLGVPFTKEEFEKAVDMLEDHSPEFTCILFSRENFPILESYLRQILLERRRKQ